MRRTIIALAGVAAIAGTAAIGYAAAQTPPGAPAVEPGWTGITHVDDLMLARQTLMVEVEKYMRPIDSFSFGEPGDIVELQQAAASVGQLMLSVPHMFPPTTNLYDPEAETPSTLALPAIWEDFDTFYALAMQTSEAARDMSVMADLDAFRQAGNELRAMCDACHAVYMRPYVPPTVDTEDLQFDFGAFG